MPRKPRYQKFDPRVKAAISWTGRPDLFPHLEIPEMTARYWIQKKINLDDAVLAGMAEALNDARHELEALRKSVAEKSALLVLLHEADAAMGFDLNWKQISSSEVRIKILDGIEKAMTTASRDSCLKELGISLSRYKRWRRERYPCGATGTPNCPRINANQLTTKEVAAMKNLVTSKRFSHFPIRSLHFYAKREDILSCSYSTWLKYISQYKWSRPRKIRIFCKERIGIRAKRPNEIWHLDVSYFILPCKKKLYIQAIIDNFSRYVVAWQVMDSYDGSRTGELVRDAIAKSGARFKAKPKLKLIVDGGTENKGAPMGQMENAGLFEKQVARFEISFSNSMVETLFRSLKHNYLFHQEVTSLASLKRHVNYWIEEHNEKIPHTAFNGETPLEMFKQSWSKEAEIRIFLRQEEAIKMRIGQNQRVSGVRCA